MPFGCVCVCSQDQKKYIVDYSFSTLRTSLFIFSLWLFIICFSSKINYIIKVTSVIYLIVNVMRIETYVTISNINYAKFFSEHFFVLGAKSRPHSRTHCTQHTLGLWSTITMKNKLYYLNWALGKRVLLRVDRHTRTRIHQKSDIQLTNVYKTGVSEIEWLKVLTILLINKWTEMEQN